jgi:hypothetical protein
MAQHWIRPGTWEVGVQTLLCTNMACDHGPARTYPLGTIDKLQVHLSRPDILSHMDWPPVT